MYHLCEYVISSMQSIDAYEHVGALNVHCFLAANSHLIATLHVAHSQERIESLCSLQLTVQLITAYSCSCNLICCNFYPAILQVVPYCCSCVTSHTHLKIAHSTLQIPLVFFS